MRAFVYTRQSLDKTGLGAAVSRQLEDCLGLCERRAYTVAEVFQDNDVSASSGKPRPQYLRMVEGIKEGRAEVVVVWDLDRLTRRPIEVEDWIALHERIGVNLVTISENVDLSTDNGRMFLRIKAAVARGEVERKGARQKRAQQQAAEQGRPAGGRRAFGYDPDGVTVREPEAEAVRAAYAKLLEGGSLRSLARAWNEAHLLTTAGNPWVHSAVRRTLQNPRYAGLRAYRGEVVGPANWPALVDEDTHAAAVALLALPERRTTASTARKYLLPRIARCGACGGVMATGHTRHGKRVYVCADGKHISRKAQPVDDLIEAIVIERLSRADAAELLRRKNAPDVSSYRSTAAAIEDRLDDLATALGEGILSLGAVRRSSDRLRRELAAVQAKIDSSGTADVLGPLIGARDVAKAWRACDLQQKRSVVETLMTITLTSPRKGRQDFDPETVGIEWKNDQK